MENYFSLVFGKQKVYQTNIVCNTKQLCTLLLRNGHIHVHATSCCFVAKEMDQRTQLDVLAAELMKLKSRVFTWVLKTNLHLDLFVKKIIRRNILCSTCSR